MRTVERTLQGMGNDLFGNQATMDEAKTCAGSKMTVASQLDEVVDTEAVFCGTDEMAGSYEGVSPKTKDHLLGLLNDKEKNSLNNQHSTHANAKKTVQLNRDDLITIVSRVLQNTKDIRILQLYLSGGLSRVPAHIVGRKNQKNPGKCWHMLDFLNREVNEGMERLLQFMVVKA